MLWSQSENSFLFNIDLLAIRGRSMIVRQQTFLFVALHCHHSEFRIKIKLTNKVWITWKFTDMHHMTNSFDTYESKWILWFTKNLCVSKNATKTLFNVDIWTLFIHLITRQREGETKKIGIKSHEAPTVHQKIKAYFVLCINMPCGDQ